MLSNRSALVVLLTAALGSAACSAIDSSPLEPTVQPPGYSEWVAQSSQSGQSGNLLSGWGNTKKTSCRPLSPASASKDIGVSGGQLRVGPHTLTVLPGALLRTVRITATVTADGVNSIQFAPEGLHFAVPALLSLSYANCKTVSTSNMKVVYTSNDLLTLLELIPSQDLKLQHNVVGLISHFSRYAVAY